MKSTWRGITLAMLLAMPLWAGIVRVPQDQPTIQAGIDAAANGDTVLVAENTYTENINFKGKAITVASLFLMDQDTSHISATVIDGSQPSNPDSGSVVYFISGEDTTSILCGFTITGGSGTYVPPDLPLNPSGAWAGGGIFCLYSSARISHNIIENNALMADDNKFAIGGAISAGAPVPNPYYAIIEGNVIRENSVTSAWVAEGGGIILTDNGRIVNNVIANNLVYSSGFTAWGGGVFWISDDQNSKSVLISGNKINHNTAISAANGGASGGGGLSAIHGHNLIITDNEIFGNVVSSQYLSDGAGAEFSWVTGNSVFSNNRVFNNSYSGSGRCDGGGLWVSRCELEVAHNIISRNAGTLGGGVFVSEANPRIFGCLISNNSASEHGGGIEFDLNCNPLLVNNTIANNYATQDGGGLDFNLNANPNIINTILFGNTAGNSGPQVYLASNTCDPNFFYCDVEGNSDAFAGNGAAGNYQGRYENNIDQDPGFLDSSNGDFQLSDFSLCIGGGIDSLEIAGAWHHAPSHDLNGTQCPNPDGSKPDIGAYESELREPITGIEDTFADNIPLKFALHQNYPNPFNPVTNIGFRIADFGFVTLTIYNAAGEKVATLVSENMAAGSYQYQWETQGLASGVYFYQLQVSDAHHPGIPYFSDTRKLLLIK